MESSSLWIGLVRLSKLSYFILSLSSKVLLVGDFLPGCCPQKLDQVHLGRLTLDALGCCLKFIVLFSTVICIVLLSIFFETETSAFINNNKREC